MRPMTPLEFAKMMARTPALVVRHRIIAADLDAEQAAIRTGMEAALDAIRSRLDAAGGENVIALPATAPALEEAA